MDKTRQERYNMIYGNTARKIEASTQPASTQPERKQRPRRKIQTTPQTKMLPALVLTARRQTVREEKIRRMQQPLLIPPNRHNKGKYVRGEKYKAPLSVFLYRKKFL